MRLALALFKYFPYGGLQRNFLAIARELSSRGHHISIFTSHWEGEHPPGLVIEVLPSRSISNVGRNHRFSTKLIQRLAEESFDLVVGFNKMPGLDVYYCADTCFATRVYEEKGFWERLTPRVRGALRYEAAIFGVASKSEVLLLSQVEGEAYRKYYNTNYGRLHLMPPGIGRDRVRNIDSDALASEVRAQLGLANSTKVLVFLGSDYKRKGLDRTLRALASLPMEYRKNCKLLVVGRDKRQANFERLAKSLGVRSKVHFLGQRDDIPSLLFASDVLLHPAYLENTGNVIVEALVAGVPVLCSGACGYAEYVSDNNLGEVVGEPFSQMEMNDKLLALLESPRDWKKECEIFSAQADVFSRPQRAAEVIEQIGELRRG